MITKDYKYCVQKPRVFSGERNLYLAAIVFFMLSFVGENSSFLIIVAGALAYIAYKKQKFNDKYVSVLSAMENSTYIELSELSAKTGIEDIEGFITEAINKRYFKQAKISKINKESFLFIDDTESLDVLNNENSIKRKYEKLDTITDLKVLSGQIIDVEFKDQINRLIQNIEKANKEIHIEETIKIVRAFVEIEKSSIEDKKILEDIKKTIEKINEKYERMTKEEMDSKIQNIEADLYVLNTIIKEDF